MPKDIIVVGASAGGIEALRVLVGGLPANFGAAVFVVLHVAPQSPGILDQILTRAGSLPAVSYGVIIVLTDYDQLQAPLEHAGERPR